MRRGDVQELPFSLDRLIAFASESCPLRMGDILCAGPITDGGDGEGLSSGDEVLIRPFLDHPDDLIANVACESLLRLTDPMLVPQDWREL